MDAFTKILPMAKADFPNLTEQQEVELEMLCKAGCAPNDYIFAWNNLIKSHRDNRWGYLRTTMIIHRSEKIVMLAEAEREHEADYSTAP